MPIYMLNLCLFPLDEYNVTCPSEYSPSAPMPLPAGHHGTLLILFMPSRIISYDIIDLT